MSDTADAASQRDVGTAAGDGAPPAAAAFAVGVSTAANLASCIEQACDQALAGLSGAAPSFAVLFTYHLGAGEAPAAELLAARLPPGCAIVGCQSHGIIGCDGRDGSQLVDTYCMDVPPQPQRGVALLLGALPGRLVAPFSATAPPPGPGAQHRLGQPITIADAAADRNALHAWLALPAGAEPASILLFCSNDEPSMFALPHPHGLLARLQRAWPDVVVQGALSAGTLHYRPGSSSSSADAAAAATQAPNYCGVVVCKAAADSGPAAPLVSAALTVKAGEGVDIVFTEVAVAPLGTTIDPTHPTIGPQQIFVIDSASADEQKLLELFRNEERPGEAVPATSVMIHYLMETPEGAELALWAADRSDPGDYASRVRAGHPVCIMDMGLQQRQGIFFVLGKVLPLDLPAAQAIFEQAQHGPGKMLCAQWVQCTPNIAREVLEAELPMLLSRRHTPEAAAAVDGHTARCVMVCLVDTNRGILGHYPSDETEMGTVRRLAPQVPLAGAYCPGIIGPNTPSNFCGLRCTSGDGAAQEEAAAAGDGVAGRLATLGLGQQEGEEAAGRRQEQEQQQQRLGVERSDVLSICMTLSLLGSA